MTRKKRIVTIVGARPQFVKVGAVSRVLRQQDGFEEILVHTGQHFDVNMSGVFFDELEIARPAYALEISGGTHGQMTGRTLEAVERVLLEVKPDGIMVYGDTNATLAGGLAGAKLSIPIIHVEAGLRSFNRAMPEEINRVLIDHLSALLLCPTRQSIINLTNEGITKGVVHTGDVMADATLFAISQAQKRSKILDTLGLAKNSFQLCTVHRAENTDDPNRFAEILDYIEQASRGLKVVLPAHPRVRSRLVEWAQRLEGRVMVIEPVGFFDMHMLLSSCAQVLTDSGGLQKEAYFHQKPCITLRDETEWVETVDAGWNRLWTSSGFDKPRRAIDDYGDGKAAEKIVTRIANMGL